MDGILLGDGVWLHAVSGLPAGAHLVLVESNGTYGRAMAKRALVEGARITLLTRNPSWYPYLADDDYDTVEMDTLDQATVLRACTDIVRRSTAPVAVTAGFELSLSLASAVARRLGLPGPDPVAVLQAATKDHMRIRLAQAGVRVPDFRVAHTVDEVAEAFDALGAASAVVKPTNTGGSIGVRLVDAGPAAQRHAMTLLGQPDDRGTRMPHRVLVEEFLEGEEYSAEVFNGNVYGVTRKRTTPPPTFIETGHDFPSHAPHVAEHAARAVRALGLVWGPAHVEIMVDQRGPAVVEINPRLAGGGISELAEWCTGSDIFGAHLDQLFGRKAEVWPRTESYGAIRSKVATEPGRVCGVRGVLAARACEGIRNVNVIAWPESIVGVHGDSRDRLVSVSATGSTAEQAAWLAEAALDLIEVDIEKIGVPA